ncbi:hypothetical protein DSO57_1006327 [Entomophthora muscae]|uniref:Uncharacterized protein n=1 Tax=Entomophthora muscae TaxID=34485 RepID=A0ACC2U6D3_9FUNG|nr:hypothetical protein DSO57_1006327 [Entomophthora muscae]
MTMDISGNKDGEDWFFLHTASDGEVLIAVQNLNRDSSYYVKLDNIYPVRPESCSKNPKLHLTPDKDALSWSWRWTPILGAPTILGGSKNVCVFIKRAGTEFHVIAEFKFWTPLPNSGRKTSSSSLHGLNHKSNWVSCSYPPLAPFSSNSQTTSEMILGGLSGKYRARQGSFESDAGEAVLGVEFEEEDDDSFTTALGLSAGVEAIFPQSALAEINFGSDYIFRDEDGPVFRATLQHLEKRVHSFKQDIKRLLKLGLEAMESRKESLRHERALMDAVLAFPSIQPLAAAYFNQATQYLRQTEDASIQLIPQLILDPLRRLYDTDIKAAESRKKQFDQVSDEYYSYLSKYLSAKDRGRRGNFSDSKYQERRRHFELCRFNYYIYIHELRGGVKDQEILSNLTIYAEKHLNGLGQLYDALLLLKPGLDQIQLRVSEAERELALQRKDLDERRRHIVKPEGEFSDGILEHTSDPSTNANSPAVLRNKFLGIRDLQATNRETSLAAGRKREGFLFTSSRTAAKFDKSLPGQASWHKKWCVLSGGCLHEYNNWKKQLEVNFEPVPLQFATVRVAFQTSRKFCFEVITPKLRRQYQATSEDDMTGWITCIANAIESLWIGTSSCDDLRKQAGLQHQPSPLGSLDQQYLLKLLQAEPSNRTCADCDTPGPEWCSINFGILLCIECSGIHRSLGTHITKVRSLALDVVTFTPDLIGLLQRLGNCTANAFWEASMDENGFYVEDSGSKWTKPTPSDDRAFKLRFITAKYVEHKFLMRQVPAPSLDSQLVQGLQDALLTPSSLTASIFAGVLQDQIMATLQPILLGGDVDGLLEVVQPSPLVKIFGLHSLVTPLHIALFCLEQTDPEVRVPYCMAELLIQNGANVNVQVEATAPTLLHFAALHNDLAAIQYLLLKGASPTVPQENYEAWPCFLVTDLACQQLLLEVTFTEAQKMNFDPGLLKLIAPPLPPRAKHPDDDEDHSPVSSPVSLDNESMNSSASLMPVAADEPTTADSAIDMGRSVSADSRNPASPIKRLSEGWKQQLQQLGGKDGSRDQSLISGFSSSFVIPKKNTFRRSAQISTIQDLSRSAESTPGGTFRSRPAISDSESSRTRHSPSHSSFKIFSQPPPSSTSSSPSPPKALTEPILADYPTPSSTSFTSTPSRPPSRTPFAVIDHDSFHPGDFLARRIHKPNRASSIIEAFRKMSK